MKGKEKRNKGLSILFCSAVYLFLFLPLFVVVANSFNATTTKPYLSWKGFTLDWYVKLWSNSSLLESFGNTMLIALLSTLLSTVIGTLGAVGIYRYKFKGKGIINGLLYIPVVIPEIVIGIALLTIFSNTGVRRGMLTLLLSAVRICVPYLISHVRASLAGYERVVEE